MTEVVLIGFGRRRELCCVRKTCVDKVSVGNQLNLCTRTLKAFRDTSKHYLFGTLSLSS